MADVPLDQIDPVVQYLVIDSATRTVLLEVRNPEFVAGNGRQLVAVDFRPDITRSEAIKAWRLADDGRSLEPATAEAIDILHLDPVAEQRKSDERFRVFTLALEAVRDDRLNTESVRALATAQLAFFKG